MVMDRHFRSPVPLVTGFDALGRLGLLQDLFREMSRRIREEALDPLLSARHVPPPKVREVSVKLRVVRQGGIQTLNSISGASF